MDKTEKLKQEVNEITNGKISIIHEDLISNNHDEVKMQCNVCGYEFKQSVHVLKNNLKDVKDIEKTYGCAICSKKRKKNTETFKQEVYDLVGDEYEVVSEYINTDTYIEMKHCKCGTMYKVRP